MLNLSYLFVLAAVFLIMWAVVGVIPELVQFYQIRYRENLSRTTRELNKFFVDVKPARILIGAAVVGGLLGILTGSWPLAALVCLAGVFAPKLILSIAKARRSEKFDAQLMDALILMGNTLKSGLDIVAGVERIAVTMKAPISEEFGLVLNAYRLGTPLEKALMDLTSRIRSRGLETVIYAINIQRETGGNIIKTFDQMVVSIREETKLQKKIRAMTSQGRTQIAFLSVFPWILGGFFMTVSPDMIKGALNSPWGPAAVAGLVVWEIIGIMVTKKIITVEV